MRKRNLIGPQVRKLRDQRRWTQEELAVRLQMVGFDVSRGSLAKIESRLVWVGDYELLYFMKVFRVSYEALYPPIQVNDDDLHDAVERLLKTRF
ncbi:helix-turn-helix transcriptional regulator [Phragmitibacter flavus]|uniref:Helix-turn-helix transcriptional regulator n=1 Tax=Phragmitibacter flavus TaxID=2576071 RepID=A0A5R8KG67_9BACT|nr:helix-turn-helix transcriptional regulator [Phragmitibacter flavus]TLD71286.1 helix-turn-helix transcriptional regulator [Phragmitibacter flavus]